MGIDRLVGLVTVVKERMVVNRTMLTKNDLSREYFVSTHRREASEFRIIISQAADSRQAKAHHAARQDLLSRAQVQLPEPRPGQADQPQVPHDADDARRQGQGVQVATPAAHAVLVVPLQPEVVDRQAVEDGGDGEGGDVHDVDDGAPQREAVQVGARGAREDAQVAEDDCCAYQAARETVEDGVPPKDLGTHCAVSTRLEMRTPPKSTEETDYLAGILTCRLSVIEARGTCQTSLPKPWWATMEVRQHQSVISSTVEFE